MHRVVDNRGVRSYWHGRHKKPRILNQRVAGPISARCISLARALNLNRRVALSPQSERRALSVPNAERVRSSPRRRPQR